MYISSLSILLVVLGLAFNKIFFMCDQILKSQAKVEACT